MRATSNCDLCDNDETLRLVCQRSTREMDGDTFAMWNCSRSATAKPDIPENAKEECKTYFSLRGVHIVLH